VSLFQPSTKLSPQEAFTGESVIPQKPMRAESGRQSLTQRLVRVFAAIAFSVGLHAPAFAQATQPKPVASAPQAAVPAKAATLPPQALPVKPTTSAPQAVPAKPAVVAPQAVPAKPGAAVPQSAVEVPPTSVPARKSPLVKAPNGKMVAADIARILSRGELVVAFIGTDSFPFFSINKDGEHVGTDIDLARLIAKELGVPVRFDRTSKTFDAAVEMAADGRADIAMGRLARTLARSQKVNFSQVYIRLGHSFLINRVEFAKISGDRAAPRVIRNFTGKLGVIANSAWEEFGRRNFPKAKIVPYPTWAKTVEAVKKGEVVAIYRDEFEIQQIMRPNPELALTLRTVTVNDLYSPISVMVGINDVSLLTFIDEVIAQRTEIPTVEEMLKELK
jgi:ABC-type amino acid transport substrate-binding protein